MIIKKIIEIKSFGCFKHFEWNNDIPEFSQYNFLYGWNYSGKTTLSRIFRYLEKGKVSGLNTLKLKFETDDGIIADKNISKKFPIRVFNEDFVKENLKWEEKDNEIEPVFILGEISIELEKQLENIKNKIDKKKEKIRDQENLKQQQENNLQKTLTSKASEIRNILNITKAKDFNRNQLESRITSLESNYQQKILTDEEKQKLLDFYRTKQKDILYFYKANLQLQRFITETKNILSRKITPQKIIEELQEDIELSNWVRKGIELHKDKTICRFCGNPLPLDLFERLNKHFSKEFDLLMEDIKNLQRNISEHREKIKEYKLPNKFELFDDLQDEYQIKIDKFNKLQKEYLDNLESLLKNLEQKKEKPFYILKIEKISDNTESFINILQEISKIVKKHNERAESFEHKRNEAKERLIDHFTAKFIVDFEYFHKKREIKKLAQKIDILKEEEKKLEERKREIEGRIKAEAIGAEKINEYLKKFFSEDRLKIKLTENGKYKLYRDDKIATNLSTGERNIISLIYFFTKLEEKEFDLNKSIVFIDDPVSSLDSNHIFSVYGFLYEKLKTCAQLFITTHNFEFFNLLKDLGDKAHYYLIKRTNNKVIINKLPNVLIKFKSEYNYLFKILYDFTELQNKDEFDLVYILPNAARRFLEAYLFMKYPDGKSFKGKCKNFFMDTDEAKFKTIMKLLDEYSHEESPERIRKFPDIQELTTGVEFILSVLKNKDPKHYEALKNSLRD